MRWHFSCICLALVSIVQAISSTGNRLLVVIEEASEKDKYSKFWGDLEGRGYKLTFESPKNEKLRLFQHGERSFDHVVLLPPKSKAFGPSLTPNLLLQFINQNGNILLILSGESTTPSAISSLLLELNISLPPDRASKIVDHFNYDTLSAPERHDVLLLDKPEAVRSDVKNFFGGDGTIAFPRAVPQELENSSPHLAPVLRSKNTAYSYNPNEDAETVEDPFAVGGQYSLVSCMQARNSARFTVFGSAEALEDKWFNAKVKKPEGKQIQTVNREFAEQVTGWTFMETGVLKVGKVEHFLSSVSDAKSGNESATQLGFLNPQIYRIKNDVTFTIELSQYSHNQLQPLIVPSSDAVQLEFSMLSPFHRLNLKPVSKSANSTTFGTTFRLPDQHGIFSFRVNYKRPFLTNIDIKREVTVRHFAHDEWPRSWEISGGWVWIAGVWVTVVGWVAFVGLWLWSEPAYERSKGKKMQ